MTPNGGPCGGLPIYFLNLNKMSWMKYLAELAEDPTAVSSMRKALQTAHKYNLSHAIYNGESITTEKLMSMIKLVEKHQQSNDSLYRDTDDTSTTE